MQQAPGLTFRRIPLVALLVSLALAPQLRAQSLNGGGFNGGGFNAGGYTARGFDANRGFNSAGFNSAPLPALGVFGGLCGRMLVPASSLASASRGFGDGHAGIDLVAASGAPIRAAAPGVISHVGQDPDYGNFVDIRHPGGLLTRYGHLSAFAPGAVAGATVLTGSLIGQVGSTGHSTGPHLHFEVRIGGVAVDPKPFLVSDHCPRGTPSAEVLEARDLGRRGTTR